MPEEVVFEPLNDFVAGSSGKRKQASAPGDIQHHAERIVEVLVKVGITVKGQSSGADQRSDEDETNTGADCRYVTAVHVTGVIGSIRVMSKLEVEG
jgi:pyruvate carboxylase subunit B